MRILILTAALIALTICNAGQSGSKGMAFLAAFGPAGPAEEPAGPGGNQASDVSLETPTGTLFGTLLLPAGKPPFPVVLLVAGSGMTDRDGNSAGLGKSDTLKLLADGLAQSGIATLRYDKRGVGASAAARAKVNTFEIQAEDAARWVAWLRQSPRFSSVGVVGHSEGALIAAIAAQGGGVRALIYLAGPGRRFDEILTVQMERAVQSGQLSQAAFAALRIALAELRAGRTIEKRPAEVPQSLWTGLFQPRAQDYLISLFRYDPVAELVKVPPKGVQVMVVQGTTDLTGRTDEPALLAAAIGVKPVLIEGMNHELK